MKNKPLRHKETNTFKFQPFAERISNIDVDIFHRIGHEFENETEEIECYFNQALQKWSVLNLTESYEAFRKEVTGIITLPQLLHRKEQVVQTLISYLKQKNPLSLQPLLELVVAVAKDLRKEFYEYYNVFLVQLIDILSTKDTEVLEWTFHCLAYLFKFLWRYLVKDVSKVFDSLLPLLDESKPEYINNFAAESFSFVARKVKDRRAFLLMTLNCVKNRPEAISGCGKLLFEVIKGVQGQFHSCSEEVLALYFSSISDKKFPRSVLSDVLSQIVSHIVTELSPKHNTVYWKSLYDTLDEFHNIYTTDPSDTNHRSLEILLKLIGETVEHRNGRFLTSPQQLFDHIVHLYDDKTSETILKIISQIAALCLLSPNVQLSQQTANQIALKVLSIGNESILLNFVESVVDSGSFEGLVLPHFLDFCITSRLDPKTLKPLTNIVTCKSPPCQNGSAIEKWKQYPLDFSLSKQKTHGFNVYDRLNEIIIDGDPKCTDDVVCALLCIPHLKNVDFTTAVVNIEKLITGLCEVFTEDRNNTETSIGSTLFFLYVSVETLVHIADKNQIENVFDKIIQQIIPYTNDEKYVCGLRVVDLCLSACSESFFTKKLLDRLYPALLLNVSSPFHEMRYLTTHIFSLFEHIPELNTEQLENGDYWKLFSICYHVESITPSVHECRDQQHHLNMLSFESPQSCLYKNTDYKEYALRYLLGVLYMNFQLLWDPVVKLIATHAHGMDVNTFWNVFSNYLKTSVVHTADPPMKSTFSMDTTCDFLSKLCNAVCELDDKPDFMNHRILLWRSLAEFADVAETKNRDVVTLFLTFINDEYLKTNAEMAKSWNIKKNENSVSKGNSVAKLDDNTVTGEDISEIPEDQMEIDSDDDDENNQSSGKILKESLRSNASFKSKLKLLLAHLTFFSKIRNTKSLHKENELYKVYLDFLTHKCVDVQRLSLDCIMTYKHKYLTPYKEHLYDLIDDKKFKNELTFFRIDADSKTVLREHRSGLIPIVMRIAYSKMTAKTGLRTGGKSSGQFRRTLVLRFLSGCHESEVMTFIKMAFKLFADKIESDISKMMARVVENFDLEHTIPPKRLQSTVNLLSIVLEKFGAISGEKLLPYLLKILFCVGGMVSKAFEQSEDVHGMYLNSLRQVRTSCLQTLTRFFNHFENYAWKSEEIDTVYKIFVWPILGKLSIEGVHSPTALLKLFMQFGQNPRYFPLLVKLDSNETDYPLLHIMKLLRKPKLHPSVINAIMDIIERLLTLQLGEEDVELPEIPEGKTVEVDREILQKLSLKQKLNFGSMILLPHVPVILERLQKKISGKNKNIGRRELIILSRISELISDPETCDNLLKLLVPVVVRKAEGTNEETVVQYTTTICNLISNVKEPSRHLKFVAPLFGIVSTVAPRKLLCEFLKTVAVKSSKTELETCDIDSLENSEIHVQVSESDKKTIEINHEDTNGIEFIQDSGKNSKRSENETENTKFVNNKKRPLEETHVSENKTGESEIVKKFKVDTERTKLKTKISKFALKNSRLSLLASKSTANKLDRLSYIITELNSWDAKWLDQPDFTRRLAAFREIQNDIVSNTLEFDLGIMIVHNCYYILRSVNDLSLRDSASNCLKSVGVYLTLKYASDPVLKEFLVSDTLLHLIRSGIKSKSDLVRNESMSFLGHLARECPKVHPVLDDLEKLTNKADLEVDFFENLQHLQLHRHVRALLKFTQVSKTLTKAFNPRTLTQFILPFASQYLCTEKFIGKNTVVDAAIEVVGTVCRLLPWHQYETILKYYLGKLRHSLQFQKQVVRIIISILDAFHYDLSKGNISANDIKSNKREFKENEEPVNEKSEEKINGKLDSTSDPENVSEIKEDEEELENLLNGIENEPDDKEIVESSEVNECVYIMDKQTVLCPSAAKRLVNSIVTGLLPQLHKSIAQMTQHESSHKVNRKKISFEKEEEDLLRVPIALAVVKLLQRLPKVMLDRNLPGIFMKLCTFLKSHLESVRRATRETLQKIMLTLGPAYLQTLLDEMSPLLTKGFQVHVLVYTMHSVLSCLRPLYKAGDIDQSLPTILDLCKTDIFGMTAEEKEVAGIVNKVSEAKTTKSFDTFQIVGQYVTEKSLMNVLLPFRDILNTSHSFKRVHKVQECLRRIVLGLVDNEFVSSETLIIFAYGTASESIPDFRSNDKKIKLTEKERERMSREKNDCFIIAPEPRYKNGFVKSHVKNSSSANAHVLIEFGLRLCYFLLKREKLKENDYKSFMDPFVSIFLECLKAKHIKLCILSLHCLCWVFKIQLPSMKIHRKEITNCIFDILHKYAAAGLSKGDNFDLVVAAFKAITILVRDVKHCAIEQNQLKMLLLYAEQDLHDSNRQATAFNTLKAIIYRKLIVPEIHQVMRKVAELSITSELSHVRTNARQVFLQFLMDYPLGKKIDTHLGFYFSQLNYQVQSGRESAIEMIQSVIVSFPLSVLTEQSGVLFLTLGARLINDESPDCRKRIAHCIKTMIERLERNAVDNLFNISVLWMEDKKINHRQLAAQLCGIIVTVEKQSFSSRIKTVVPKIILQFAPNLNNPNQPGRYIRISTIDESKSESEINQDVQSKDHHLFQVLQLLLKICTHCPAFLKETEDLFTLGIHAQTLLAYPHQWVRLAAAQFLGYVLSSIDSEHLADLLVNDENGSGFLCNDPRTDVKSLALDLCAQLQTEGVDSEMAEQVVKNLVFIAKVLKRIPVGDFAQESNNINEESKKQSINLLWLAKRIRKAINAEIAQTPHLVILRTAAFKWIAGVTISLDKEILLPISHHLIAPLVREMSDDEDMHKELKYLARQVSNHIKSKIGGEKYNETVLTVQMNLTTRRAAKRKIRKQLAVTDPEQAAKRKLRVHMKKKELKKRKMAVLKGKQFSKKKKQKVAEFSEK